jgi:hypothetical protein
MSSAIVRQWLILSMLPFRPRRIDTSTIENRLRARGIDVHRRTIQRDLNELAAVFPIVSDERAKPFGWRWSNEAYSTSLIPPPNALSISTVDITVRVTRASLRALLDLVMKVDSAEIVGPPEFRTRA